MAPLIYSGREIQLLDYRLADDSSTLVVSFPRRSDNPSFRRGGFGEGWFERIGVSAIVVRASTNHWFQTPELDDALAAVRDIAKSFQRVVSYGSSMGAYGALASSGAIGAHAVLAISPLATMDRTRVPWEKRWEVDHEYIVERYGFRRDNLAAQVNHSADIIVVADSWMVDGRHAAIISSIIPSAQIVHAPSFGHSATTGLRDIGIISAFSSSIIKGDAGAAYWRNEIRRRRRDFLPYWIRLAKRAAESRRVDLAIAAANIAEGHDLSDHQCLDTARARFGANDWAGTIRLMGGVKNASVETEVLRARALWKLGRANEAMQVLATIEPSDHARVISLKKIINDQGERARSRSTA